MADLPFDPAAGGELGMLSDVPEIPKHEPEAAQQAREAATDRSQSKLAKGLAGVEGAIYDRKGHSWVAMQLNGKRDKIPWEQIPSAKANGWKLITDGREFKTDQELQQEYRGNTLDAHQGIGDKAIAGLTAAADTFVTGAFGGGALSALPGGPKTGVVGGDEVAGLIGGQDAVAQVAEKRQANPITSAIGAIAGAIPAGAAAEKAVSQALSKVPMVSRALSSEGVFARAAAGGFRGAVSNMAAGDAIRGTMAGAANMPMFEEGWYSALLDHGIDGIIGGALGAAGGAASRINSLSGTPGEDLVSEVRRGVATAKADAAAAKRAAEVVDLERGNFADTLAGHAEAQQAKNATAEAVRGAKDELFDLKTANEVPHSKSFAEHRADFERIVPEPPEGAPASQRIQYAEARGYGSTPPEFSSKGLQMDSVERDVLLESARLGTLRPQFARLREDVAGMRQMANAISARAELAGNVKLARKIDKLAGEVADIYKVRVEFDPSIDGPMSRVYVGAGDDLDLATSLLSDKDYKLSALYDHLKEGMRVGWGGGDLSMARSITADGLASTMDDIDEVTSALKGAADATELPGWGGEMVADDAASHIPDPRHGAPTFKPSGVSVVSDPAEAAKQALKRSESAPAINAELTASERHLAETVIPERRARVSLLEKVLIPHLENQADSALRRWGESQELVQSATDRLNRARTEFGVATQPIDALKEATNELGFIAKQYGLKKATEAEIRAVHRLTGGVFDDEAAAAIAIAERHFAKTSGKSSFGRFGRSLASSAMRSFAWRVMTGGPAGAVAGNIASMIGSKAGAVLGMVAQPVKRLTPGVRMALGGVATGRYESEEEKSLSAAQDDMQADDALREVEAHTSERLRKIIALDAGAGAAASAAALRRFSFLRSKLGRYPTVMEVQGKMVPVRRSDSERRQWKLYVKATRSPAALAMEIATGAVNPETAEATFAVFPQTFSAMKSIAEQKLLRGDYKNPTAVMQAFGIPQNQVVIQTMQQIHQANPSPTATKGEDGSARLKNFSRDPSLDNLGTASAPHFPK